MKKIAQKGSCQGLQEVPEDVQKVFVTSHDIPPEWHLRIALSFGYPAEEERLSAEPKKGGRRSLEEVVHWDRW